MTSVHDLGLDFKAVPPKIGSDFFSISTLATLGHPGFLGDSMQQRLQLLSGDIHKTVDIEAVQFGWLTPSLSQPWSRGLWWLIRF